MSIKKEYYGVWGIYAIGDDFVGGLHMDIDYTESYLSAVVKDMGIDLNTYFEKSRNNLKHKGLKGASAELYLIERFFEARYPFLHGCGGEIITSKGYRSPQMDIILYHMDNTPLFFSNSKQYNVVPIEGVIGTAEIKTVLDTRGIKGAMETSISLKSQPKTAFWEYHKKVKYNYWGKTYDYFPVYTMLLAKEGPSMDCITEFLLHSYGETPLDMWLDCIFVLDRGLIFVDRIENKAIIIEDVEGSLLVFYTMSYALMSMADRRPIRPHDYAGFFAVPNRVLELPKKEG